MTLALLYLVAALAYGWHFATRTSVAGRVATGVLLVAVLAHTFTLGMYTMELGVPPMAGRTGAVSTFVWMLGLSYLSIEVSTDERGMDSNRPICGASLLSGESAKRKGRENSGRRSGRAVAPFGTVLASKRRRYSEREREGWPIAEARISP